MSTHTLTESDWPAFVRDHIMPLMAPETGSTAEGRGTASGLVLALVGELGAGKTTFSKALLKELGVVRHVQSPTFSIMNSYEIDTAGLRKVFHVDAYRLEDPKELETLRFREAAENPGHLVVVEWADTVRELIPEDAVWIFFEHDTQDTRRVRIERGTGENETGNG